MICIDFVMFLVLLYVNGDVASISCELQVRHEYRKVRDELNGKGYQITTLNAYKWKKNNSEEEMKTFLTVRRKVMDVILKSGRSTYKAASEANQRKIAQNIIREELMKIKQTNSLLQTPLSILLQTDKRSEAAGSPIKLDA